MKTMYKSALVLLILLITLQLLAVGNLKDFSLSTLNMKDFRGAYPMYTITALSAFNGKSSAPAYAAVEGEILDFSDMRLWSNGNHMALHNAGLELTHELKRLSPHRERKTAGIEPVGVLVITLKELESFNGRNRMKSYVAVEGKVYDFTQLNRWRNGSHQGGMHLAGEELTSELLKDSPHGVRRIQGVDAVALFGVTIDELPSMNGRDGKKAYVAVSGKVYDFSNFSRWRNGSHQGGMHLAGEELTRELLEDSPHGDVKLDGAYLVGILVFTPEQLKRFDGITENRKFVAYEGIVYDVADLGDWTGNYGVELDRELSDKELSLLEEALVIGFLVYN